MKIRKSIFNGIRSTVGAVCPETGGLLGINTKGIITAFEFEPAGEPFQYIPDINKFNSTLNSWSHRGIMFGGIVHSHPNGVPLLSPADITYIERIFAFAFPALSFAYFPVVFSAHDGGNFEMICYRARSVSGNILITREDVLIC